MNRLFVCILLSGLVAYAAATLYTDCGSKTGEVSVVEVSGCPDGQDVCQLKKNTKPLITIKFNSKIESKSLKAVVHGVIAGVPVPFPLPQPDACKCGVTCPVQSGQDYTYNKDFNVRGSYPPVPVGVQFELKDENGDDMACVQIPCQIVD